MTLININSNFFEEYDKHFFKLVFEYLGEEIFVTDKNGKTLYVNPASVKTIGRPLSQIVGHNVEELVSEGLFSVSVTLEVINKRKTVNVLQKMQDGRTLLATGIPIFDDTGEIEMIISTSKNVEEINELLHTVERQSELIEKNIEELQNLKDSIFDNEGFISSDPAMKNIKSIITRVAPLDVPILIEGDTGVGKEVAARSLHQFSNRSSGAFIKINCGAIPEQLMESELFGYEGGAFTGATKGGKKGRVEMAHQGTLFLDEIGEMPLTLQVKLLDFLQDGSFTRVGGTKRLIVDNRIIAATNRDLKKMCANGQFREDLFYRLNVIPFNIPPLRNRPDDIDVLTKYYMSKYNSKYHCNKRMEDGLPDILKIYRWPGNVRELENVLERAFVMSDDHIVSLEDLKQILQDNDEPGKMNNIMDMEIMPLKEAKWAIEKHLVGKAYEKYKSTYKVAKVLQIDQSTVVKLLHKHNL